MFHRLDDHGKRSYDAAVHRATRTGATLLLSCFSDANAPDERWPRPAGWDIESLEPATMQREMDGAQGEMAFWHVRAQRR